MAYELRCNPALAVERLFEGEDYQHLVHVLLHQLDALLLPRPQLGADKKDHRDAKPVELRGKPKVDIWEVDEDRDVWLLRADSCLKAAKLAIDAGQVADDLGDAHNRHIFRANDAFEPDVDHARSAHADEPGRLSGGSQLPLELLDEKRAVVLAAGLAGRDKDGGLGHTCAAAVPRWQPS